MTQYFLMQYYSGFSTNLLKVHGLHYRRGVAPPDFGRSVNPISTRGGGRLCLLNITGTPRFSDLPTALYRIVKLIQCVQHNGTKTLVNLHSTATI